jgi:hypothetical protein
MTKATLSVVSETQFKVDRDVPIPAFIEGGRKYPFNTMNVGDSFAVSALARPAVITASVTYARKHGVKFTTRKDGSGYRIWRIK